jgi:hypothetical protein
MSGKENYTREAPALASRSRLQDIPAKRCTSCLWNESERTENLLLVGFLSFDTVPLIEVRLHCWLVTRNYFADLMVALKFEVDQIA